MRGAKRMDVFTKLFGEFLVFVYHCFDRIVIHGYLTALSRPELVVHFFRDIVGVAEVSKEVLSQRTNDYQRWVEAYARNHSIPIEWAEKGVRKEDHVLPWLERSPSELNCGRDSRIGFDLLEDCRRAKEAAGMALSDDLRERVVGAVVEGGMSRNAAAKRFGVSIASAVRWVARFKAKGEISPAPTGGDRRSGRIEAHRDYLLGLIRRRPDMTLLEMQERLIANCGERFSSSVLWRFFDRHEITFKKPAAHAEEQQRSDVVRQRRDWFARQLDLDPTRLVFIDETWASTNMARMRGRCRRGRRLRAAVPHGHYKTVTLVAGLRLCGLVAQKAFDRPVMRVLARIFRQADAVGRPLLHALEDEVDAIGGWKNVLCPPRILADFLARPVVEGHRQGFGYAFAPRACADIFKPAECVNYFEACGYDTGCVEGDQQARDEKAYSKLKAFLRKIAERTDICRLTAPT